MMPTVLSVLKKKNALVLLIVREYEKILVGCLDHSRSSMILIMFWPAHSNTHTYE